MEDDAAMQARFAVLGSSAADSQALPEPDDDYLYQIGLAGHPESEMQPTQSLLLGSAPEQPGQRQPQRAASHDDGEARDPHDSVAAAALGSERLDDDVLLAIAQAGPGAQPGSPTIVTDAPEPSAAAAGDRQQHGGAQKQQQQQQQQPATQEELQLDDDELLLLAAAVRARGALGGSGGLWGCGRGLL
jgi:hypothetical protein